MRASVQLSRRRRAWLLQASKPRFTSPSGQPFGGTTTTSGSQASDHVSRSPALQALNCRVTISTFSCDIAAQYLADREGATPPLGGFERPRLSAEICPGESVRRDPLHAPVLRAGVAAAGGRADRGEAHEPVDARIPAALEPQNAGCVRRGGVTN